MPPIRTHHKSASSTSSTPWSLSVQKEPGALTKKLRTDVLISIKPQFVQLIAKQAKNHEYRKYKLGQVERLWLYETAPISKITSVITVGPARVPGQVKDPSGVGNDDFDAGKKESKYGYPIRHMHKLTKPISAADLKKYQLSSPQGFQYVTRKFADGNPLDQMKEVF